MTRRSHFNVYAAVVHVHDKKPLRCGFSVYAAVVHVHDKKKPLQGIRCGGTRA